MNNIVEPKSSATMLNNVVDNNNWDALVYNCKLKGRITPHSFDAAILSVFIH